MGFTTETLIFCDGGNDCPMDGPYGDGDSSSATATEQRKHFKSAGWLYRSGKDYCPDCKDRVNME